MTPRVIAAAFRGGPMEVIQHQGHNALGVRGPGSIVLLPSAGAAVCLDCEAVEAVPDPPASIAAGEARTALLAPGTESHGLFVASWLHRLAKAHAHAPALPDTGGDGDDEGDDEA